MVGQESKSSTRRRTISANALLLATTLLIALAGAEIALRYLFDPLDFLTPALVRDPDLRYRIAPGTGGHDEWGFRNKSVPSHADVVAIGDSMTYGLSAPSSESWPAWLGKLSNHSVYNMGIGGYGPVEYSKILERQAKDLTPRIAIIALYLGNDIYDAYVSDTGEQDPEIERLFLPAGMIARVRNWLSKNSMLYGTAKAAFPRLVDLVRSRDFREKLGDGVVTVDLWGQPQLLTTSIAARTMDLGDQRNVAGLSKTVTEIGTMADVCRRGRFTCYFMLIPTKQRVIQPLIEPALSETDRKLIDDLAEKEEALAQSLTAAISALGSKPIDPLNDLRVAARTKAIYPATDGHPNGDGYEIIAGTVLQAIRHDLEAATVH